MNSGFIFQSNSQSLKGQNEKGPPEVKYVSYQMCVAFEAFLTKLWQVIIACSDYQKTTVDQKGII